MSLPYFPFYPTDFEADTSHLTLAEDGAYNRLLRLCWMTPGCSLPADDAWVLRRMRVRDDAEREAVLSVLSEFFTVEKGRYSNARLTRIFQESNEAHEKRKNAGAKGGKSKARKTNETAPSNATAMPKQPEPEPHSVSKDTGADAPIDPAKIAFDEGRKLLAKAGIPDRQARSIVGKWRRDHPDPAIIDAIGRTIREGASDPVEFVTGCLRASKRQSKPEPGATRTTPDGKLQTYHPFEGWMTTHA